MALRAANGLLDGVTALLVLLAVVWSGYALWDNSRVYAAADNVQAGLLAFKPQPQEDNSLSFGQLRDINPDVCGWLTLDGTAIDYPVVQGESNFTYLNTDVYGSFALAGSIFLDVDCDADFSGRYSLLYGHHMENGRMFGDLDKYKDGAFFRQNTTGTLTLPGGSYRLEVLACLVVPASEQAIFAPGKWRSDAGGLLPFVEENALQMDAQALRSDGETRNCSRRNALQMDAQALRALEEEPEGAQFLAMATCSGEYTDARTVVLARMEPMSDLQNGKEESLS
jgi:sortase B